MTKTTQEKIDKLKELSLDAHNAPVMVSRVRNYIKLHLKDNYIWCKEHEPEIEQTFEDFVLHLLNYHDGLFGLFDEVGDKVDDE